MRLVEWHLRARKSTNWIHAQEQCGLHELYRAESPELDIVAVHGLGGHPFRTWTTDDKQHPVLWLRDLLPASIPNARILSYGYDANFAAVLGRTSSDGVLQHAITLVSQLVANRELNGAMERPIIFVCHSLGGIVVKRALAYSASQISPLCPHLNSIKVSTYGVLFLATPHNGSSKADTAMMLRRIVDACVPSSIVDTSGQLITALREGSEVLQNVTDLFVPLMADLKVYFFWEQHKTKLPNGNSYVVKELSAAPILTRTERCGIPGDHRSVCRFQTRSDPGYPVVLAVLLRYSKDALVEIPKRWAQRRTV